MRNLPIDGAKVEFIATGKVLAKPAYVEMADGSRRKDPNGRQAEDKDNGLPLWTVDCIYDDEEAEDRRAETIGVTVASATKPEVTKFRPVQFEGLTANVYLPKGSNFPAFSFKATGVAGSAGAGAGSASKSKTQPPVSEAA